MKYEEMGWIKQRLVDSVAVFLACGLFLGAESYFSKSSTKYLTYQGKSAVLIERVGMFGLDKDEYILIDSNGDGKLDKSDDKILEGKLTSDEGKEILVK